MLAVTRVLAGEPLEAVIARLVRQVRSRGVTGRFLLLDKAFFTVAVVRYFQAARCPFLRPAVPRGRKPKRIPPGSLRAFQARTRSGWEWECYRWTNRQGRPATVRLAIVCRNYAGQRRRRGRRTQLYACWGLPRRSAAWVAETYRRRFGIETSYRQMNEARIRTSTQNPLLRLLFVALALILRNVWGWCHLHWLAVRRGPGLLVRDELLRLGELLLWLARWAEEHFGLRVSQDIPPPPRIVATT